MAPDGPGAPNFSGNFTALQRGVTSKSRHIAKHFTPHDLAGVQIDRGQIGVAWLEQWQMIVKLDIPTTCGRVVGIE